MHKLADVREVFHAERIGLLPQKPGDVFVETFGVKPVHLGGVRGEGRIDKNGHRSKAAIADQLMQLKNDLLSAPDRERRDDHFSAAANRFSDEHAEVLFGILLRGMKASA